MKSFSLKGLLVPGPCGKADLMADGTVLDTYDFYANGDIVIITNLGNFYYRDWKLIWIQGQFLALDGDGNIRKVTGSRRQE